MSYVVNLFGGPGAGKSTTRAGVFHRLKLMGYNIEEVPEYAKDLTWSKRYSDLDCQAYVFGTQLRNLQRVLGQVRAVITDSPIILSSIYAPPDYPPSFHDFVFDMFGRLNSINYYIERVKTYNPAGRNQTEAEARLIDDVVLRRLEEKNIDFTKLPGNEQTAIDIANAVANILGPP